MDILSFTMAQINFYMTVFTCKKLRHAVEHLLISVNGLVKLALFWESARFFLGHLYGHLMKVKKVDA